MRRGTMRGVAKMGCASSVRASARASALIDVRMPGMDGWTMSDHMRGDPDATIASTSVVLVSGDPAAQARARAAGIREFLPKPLDGAALIGAVERYCGRRAV